MGGEPSVLSPPLRMHMLCMLYMLCMLCILIGRVELSRDMLFQLHMLHMHMHAVRRRTRTTRSLAA